MIRVLALWVAGALAVATALVWKWSKSYTQDIKFGWIDAGGTQRDVSISVADGRFFVVTARAQPGGRVLFFRNGWKGIGGLRDPMFTWDYGIHRGPLGFSAVGFKFDYAKGPREVQRFIIVPCYAVFVLLAAWPLARLMGRPARARQTDHLRCRKCGYDLRASTARCPECGTPVPHGASARHESVIALQTREPTC
jgi:ribosomal protein L37E